MSGFYARRVRRILPASALVVVVTVVAAYYFLGFISGNDVATAAKWTAVFAANIHFGLVGTDYCGSQMPPSPLQHMWSLGVEEQFYVLWPGLFFLLVLVGPRHPAPERPCGGTCAHYRPVIYMVGGRDHVERFVGVLFSADAGMGTRPGRLCCGACTNDRSAGRGVADSIARAVRE